MEAPPPFVTAIIYRAKCTHPLASGNGYVGQTRSHVLNHSVYRPFGAEKRWSQHLSEARVNNSTKQSWKLNHAIRKYGDESFEIETLGSCDLDCADLFERLFIETFDTIKNGYNITKGGRGGPTTEASRLQISKTLTSKNDARRLEKYKDADICHVRLTKLEDKGIRIYVLEACGRETYTSIFGRHTTMAEAVARAKPLTMALAGGDLAKIHVVESLKTLVKFDV